MPDFKVTWEERRVVGDAIVADHVEGHFSNPCQAVEALRDRSAHAAVREQHQHLVQKWQQLCTDWKKFHAESGPKPEPPEPDPNPTTAPGAGDAAVPPSDDDTPELQGAQFIEVTEQVSAEAEPVPISDSTAALYVMAPPPHNLPVEWVQPLLMPPPVSVDESESRVRNLLLGKPPPGERSAFHAGHGTHWPPKGGDPVDLFSGSLVITEIDFDVPTPFLPLHLMRTYRSGLPYFGPWGFNWDHNYNVYLRELTDGGVALWNGRMHEDYFRWTGEAFESDYGVHTRLERIGAQEYRLTHPGGVAWHFSFPASWSDPDRIPLVEIRDRHQNRIELEYGAKDHLLQVRDEAGRGLFFQYGTCDLLEAIVDHSGKRRVEYSHHSEIEHLIAVKLASGVQEECVTTGYEYDFLDPHPAVRHNLLRVADAEGGTYLQNEYGKPETGWKFNRIAQQLHGDFSYQFDYEQLQHVPEDPVYLDVLATRTTVRPPDGSLHTYTFNYRGDLLDHRFRLNRDGSYRVVAQQWKYDAHANIIQESGPDGTTHFKYDDQNSDPCARGNLVEVSLASTMMPGTGRTIFQGSYHPTYQLPLEIRDEDLRTTCFVYDSGPGATGTLQRIELPAVTLPDAAGTPQQSIIHFKSNVRGQVTETVSTEGMHTEIHYFAGAPGNPLLEGFLRETVQDSLGVAYATSFDYDDLGRLERIDRPPAIATHLSYDVAGMVEEITLPEVDGSKVRYRFRHSSEGNLTEVERPRGEYVDGMVTGDFIVDHVVLDCLGRVREQVLGANTARPRRTRYSRDHAGRPLETVDPEGVRVRRRYDERGLLLSEGAEAASTETGTTRFTYTRAGQLRRVENPDGSVNEIRDEDRDLWGRVIRFRMGNGAEERLEWKPMDRLAEVRTQVDPGDGSPPREVARRRFDYDERGRLIRDRTFVFRNDSSAAVELVTTYFYDADDRIREVRLPRGGLLKYDYDGLGRLVRLEDVYGNVETITYGAPGDIEKITRVEVEPGGTRTSTWTCEHDDRGRLRKVTIPGGAMVELRHDDRDLVVERREPLGVTIRSRYGLLEELEERRLEVAGGSFSTSSRYDCDLLGRLVRFVDPLGEATEWERDELGRLTRLRLPQGAAWELTYNGAGQLVKRETPSGSHISFAYGKDTGELEGLACVPGGGTLPVAPHSFAFDALGRLVRAACAGEVVERDYDSLGRVVRESAHGKSVEYEYDDLAGTIELAYPDGRRERTELDLGGRPTRIELVSPGAFGGAVGTQLAEFVYSGRDRLHAVEHGNGVGTTLVYDEALRLIRLDHAEGGQLLESCRYRYDARHRRRLAQWLGTPQTTRLHSFDGRDRLVQAAWGFALPFLADALSQQQQDSDILAAEQAAATAAVVEAYTLNGADSRVTRQRTEGGGQTQTQYQYSTGHQPVLVGSESLAHHPDGPRTQDNKFTYEMDALGRVVRVRDAVTQSVKAEFQYDPLSRLARVQMGAGVVQRWFGNGRWIHEADGSGATLRQATPHPLGPLPLLQHRPNGTLLPLADGSFSTLGFAEGSGKIVERTRFEPFGAAQRFSADGVTPLSSSAATGEIGFGGMAYLDDLLLFQSQARLYDPEQGLFLARDPLLYADSPSSYLYAQHNPVDFIDPSGAGKERPTAQPAESAEGGAERIPWWMPAQAYGRTAWHYQPGEYDLYRPLPGVDTGSRSANLVVNSLADLYNIYTVNANTVFRAMGEGGEAIHRTLRWIGFSEYEINAPPLSPAGAVGSFARAPRLLAQSGGRFANLTARFGSALASARPRYAGGLRSLIADQRGAFRPGALLPSGGPPPSSPRRLPILNPVFTPSKSVDEVFQGATSSIVGKLDQHPTLVAEAPLHRWELDQLLRDPDRWAPAMFGRGVERWMARFGQEAGLLQWTGEVLVRDRRGRFVRRKDFIGAGQWSDYSFEITTNEAFASHYGRPYGTEVTYGLYDMPASLGQLVLNAIP